MKTFVINLKRSTDRRARITKVLGDVNVEFEFFDAIEASTPNFKYSERGAPKQTKLRFGYQLLESELACFASHLCLWEKSVELNETILVLEDSCELTPAFLQFYDSFKEIASEFQFIKLCSLFPKKFTLSKQLTDSNSIVRYKKRTCGTQCYLLTPQAAQQLIKGATVFLEPVDHYIEKSWRHGISVYSFKPNIVERQNIVSTIGSSRKNKKGLLLWQKAIIESFRAYERIRAKIGNFTFKINSQQKQVSHNEYNKKY